MKTTHDGAVLRLRWKRAAIFVLATTLLVLTGARADTYLFGIMVGNGAALDHTDGTGSNARFFNPTSIAIDSAGTLYVADGGDHTVRRITAGGVVTTLAGASGQAGSNDGTGSGARFQYPYAIAVDATGNVYVTDIGDHTVRRISAGGSVSTLAGLAGVPGSADGVGANSRFNGPQGVTVDATGNVYVSDTNNSTIRKITANGTVTTFAGVATQTGTADGAGSGARFNYPAGLAADSVGNVYVADFGNSSIRKITTGGNVTTLAGTSGQTGVVDGAGGAARFDHPSAVSVDGAGNVYAIDTSNQTVRRISISGSVTTLAGSAGFGGKTDGAGAAARFFYPAGIAVNQAGTAIYVADTGNHNVRAITAAGAVSTLAGATGLIGITDGVGGEALFAYPDGLAVDSAGTVYVADHNNHTIRKITAGGAVTTLAGAAGLPGSADGSGAAARFNGPTGVAVDGTGNVYVSDAGNSTIRKITAAGVVSTLAGVAGQTGSADGPGAAARFNNPQGLAVDVVGNVYVADTNNSVIRKITAAGIVSTLAGAAGQSGNLDGAGAGARFNGPYAVAVDAAGNVYVADFFNATIRKIDAVGNVITLAGFAGQVGVVDGFGASARFNQIYGIAVDGSGNVFVTDTYNRAVRKISAGGNVSTLSGPLSRFYYPQGIAADAAGNLYIADGDNQTITKATLVAPPPSGTLLGDRSVTAGQNTTFTVGTALSGTTYQWQVSADSGVTWTPLVNDATYAGTTTPTLTINGVSTALSGRQYRAQLSNVAGTSTSAAGTLTVGAGNSGSTGTAHLSNLSVRTQVGAGANAVFVGFAISGAGSKQMLIRGIGPGLTQFGVTGALTTPQLALYSNNVPLGTNTGWGGSTAMASAFAAVGAFPLPPTSADSAMLRPLATGVYSAQLAGVNDTTGIALAEFYDSDTGTPGTRLTNVSARAPVGTGSGVLTAGFVIAGTGSTTVLIRGIGPALTQFGVNGALTTPNLTLFDAGGNAIANNSAWGGAAALTTAFGKVGAFALPTNSADTALLVTVQSGIFTVQLSGANNTTGIGLIEVYEVP